MDLDRIPPNAGKPKVEELIEAMRQHVEMQGWTAAGDEDVFEQAVSAYLGTWPAPDAAEEDEEKTWKFLAFQATWPLTTARWGSGPPLTRGRKKHCWIASKPSP